MHHAHPTKAAIYRKACAIGILLSLTQIAILFISKSYTLGADTLHSIGDNITLAATAYLFARAWANQEVFTRRKRWCLLLSVWSLGLGGFLIAIEAFVHLVFEGAVVTISPLSVMAAGLIGWVGNRHMHKVLHAVETHDHDALHRSNLDHVFWDMVTSGAVFLSGLCMLLFHTTFIDHVIAIIVGGFILPYLALKRWGEGNEEVEHHCEHHAHHHHDDK